ncbi:cytidylate kinase [Candidatus Geothermarchaeota archaeon]|nr:MAG: cytidylate kinase [Candidatus Geothermarchaeota archaeon]
MRPEDLIITISGWHGVGKSVYSKAIAKKFKLRRLSAGGIFRRIAKERGLTIEELSELALKTKKIDKEIDSYVIREAKKGGVVVDALLSGWLLKDVAHIRIFLTAPFEERVRRIAERDGKSFEEAFRETKLRESSEKKRFREYYGINLDDLSVYNFLIDTTLGDVESIKEVIYKLVEGYMKTH